MKVYDYLIVGAGLFGSVFAHEAVKKGKSCLVVDRRGHAGGNVYTEKVEGVTVHKYGAHIFHTDDERVWKFISKFAKFNNFINSPVANYNGEIYNLPFNMNTFCRMWNISSPEEAKQIIAKQVKDANIHNPRNLEEQALSMVGRDVYEKLVKEYTEKQWGRPCQKLPAFIIKRLPVRFTFDNNYFNDKYQGIPIGGYTPIIGKLLKGCDVKLNFPFTDPEKFKDYAETVVYTGALDELFGYAYGSLEYRSLKFETEVLDTENFQGNAVVNYTSLNVPYTRIIEHKHFEFGKQPKTVITREYPQPYTKGGEAFYPVNNDKNDALAEKYKKLARESGIIFGGRLAEYKYYDMDRIIKNALELADKIL